MKKKGPKGTNKMDAASSAIVELVHAAFIEAICHLDATGFDGIATVAVNKPNGEREGEPIFVVSVAGGAVAPRMRKVLQEAFSEHTVTWIGELSGGWSAVVPGGKLHVTPGGYWSVELGARKRDGDARDPDAAKIAAQDALGKMRRELGGT